MDKKLKFSFNFFFILSVNKLKHSYETSRIILYEIMT